VPSAFRAIEVCLHAAPTRVGFYEGQFFISGGAPLLEEGSRLHTPALRAFEFVDRKVVASWMLFDASERQWLAAVWASIIHAKIKRHGAYLCALATTEPEKNLAQQYGLDISR
jgi:hypothetical protein